MIRRARLRPAPRWPLAATVLAGLLGAGLILQPAVQDHRETRQAIAALRTRLEGTYATDPSLLDHRRPLADAVGGPAFYQLPGEGQADKEAHARTSVLVTQVLEVIKATGAPVLQVGIGAPQRFPGHVRVPGMIVWQGDYADVQRVVKTVSGLGPQVGWQRCRLSPEAPLDEPDPARPPRNLLRVELGFVATFDLPKAD